MKKLILLIAIILGLQYNCYANPNSQISVTPVVSNTVISSSAYNANNNTIQTTFNSHTHTDLTQLSTIITGTWAATPITYPFLNLTGQILTADLATQTKLDMLSAVYPIGSVYINASVATNPATLLGFGTWTAFGTGRILVGVDAGQTEFATLGLTGGSKTHTNTLDELVPHTHTYFSAGVGSPYYGGGGGIHGTTNTGSTGNGTAYSILNPYITVYMWLRTA